MIIHVHIVYKYKYINKTLLRMYYSYLRARARTHARTHKVSIINIDDRKCIILTLHFK